MTKTMTKTMMKMRKKAPNHIPGMEALIQPMIAMMNTVLSRRL